MVFWGVYGIWKIAFEKRRESGRNPAVKLRSNPVKRVFLSVNELRASLELKSKLGLRVRAIVGEWADRIPRPRLSWEKRLVRKRRFVDRMKSSIEIIPFSTRVGWVRRKFLKSPVKRGESAVSPAVKCALQDRFSLEMSSRFNR